MSFFNLERLLLFSFDFFMSHSYLHGWFWVRFGVRFGVRVRVRFGVRLGLGLGLGLGFYFKKLSVNVIPEFTS
jgi:hypothetical protein